MSTTNKITHISTALTFLLACFGLWALLQSINFAGSHAASRLPSFTAMVVGLRVGLLFLPVPAIAWCLFAICRREHADKSGLAFLSTSMCVLCFLSFTVLLAAYIPVLFYLESR